MALIPSLETMYLAIGSNHRGEGEEEESIFKVDGKRGPLIGFC